MCLILLLHSFYSLNAAVFGNKKRRGKKQTAPPPPPTTRSGKCVLINVDFSQLYIKLQFFNSDTEFLAKQRQPYRIALAVSSGKLFCLWYMIMFLQIEWNKYLLLHCKFYIHTLGIE